MKQKSYSANRLFHLEKIGFEMEAEKLRKQNINRKKFNEIKHQQRSLSRKRILTHIEPKQNIGNFLCKFMNDLEPTKIISVTAHKWVIYDFYSIQYIRGYRAHDKAQLGVFSKLLVFCTINTLIKKHKLDPSKFQTIVTPSVLRMFPNQKKLHTDDIISLEDLLHLMILDESQIYQVILSANVGAYLHKKHKNQYYSVYDVNQKTLKEHLKYFYELVNSYCKLMHLENVKYIESDPTLRKEQNFCCAADVAKLSIECMNIPLYVAILKKKQHTVEIKYVDNKGHLTNKHMLILNKCIEHKFIPYVNVCRNWEEKQFLSSHCSIQYDDQKASVRPILVVLLSSYSPKDRQKDIQQIVEWYLKSENVLQPQKKSESLRTQILKTQPTEKVDDILNKKIQQKLTLTKSIKFKDPTTNQQKGKPNEVKRVRRVINIKTQQSQ